MQRGIPIMLALLITGCGAEVVGTAAVIGTTRNEEAKQALKEKEKIEKRLNAATQAAQQQREQAEKLSNQ